MKIIRNGIEWRSILSGIIAWIILVIIPAILLLTMGAWALIVYVGLLIIIYNIVYPRGGEG